MNLLEHFPSFFFLLLRKKMEGNDRESRNMLMSFPHQTTMNIHDHTILLFPATLIYVMDNMFI